MVPIKADKALLTRKKYRHDDPAMSAGTRWRASAARRHTDSVVNVAVAKACSPGDALHIPIVA